MAYQPLMTPTWLATFQAPDHPQGQGRGGISCPQDLMELADINGMTVKDTVSNGDCLFGAFAISAAKFIEPWTWKTCRYNMSTVSAFQVAVCIDQIKSRSNRRQPWSLVKKDKNRVRAIRTIACDWAESHAAEMVWEDFTLGDLVRTVSGETFARWWFMNMNLYSDMHVERLPHVPG